MHAVLQTQTSSFTIQKSKLMELVSISKITSSNLTIRTMRKKIQKMYTNTKSRICCPVCSNKELSHASHTVRLAQVKRLRCQRPHLWQCTNYSDWHHPEQTFSSVSMKFMVERSWICSTTRNSCLCKKMPKTAFKCLGLRRDVQSLLKKWNSSLNTVTV